LAKETSGAKAGKTDFLAKYGDAVKEIVKKLSPAEKKQATDLAEEWYENGLSNDVQLKYEFITSYARAPA
jgi:hypothetical protein